MRPSVPPLIYSLPHLRAMAPPSVIIVKPSISPSTADTGFPGRRFTFRLTDRMDSVLGPSGIVSLTAWHCVGVQRPAVCAQGRRAPGRRQECVSRVMNEGVRRPRGRAALQGSPARQGSPASRHFLFIFSGKKKKEILCGEFHVWPPGQLWVLMS